MNKASREAVQADSWSSRPLFDLLPVDEEHRQALQRDFRAVEEGMSLAPVRHNAPPC